MEYSIEKIVATIPFLNGSTQVKKIEEGYSPDEKYIVVKEENKYLLRIANITYAEKRKREFQLLKEIANRKVRSQRPIEFQVKEENQLCFLLMEYIEGVPASEAFKNCSEQIQYQIGEKAGKELYRIHQIKAPADRPIWEVSQRKKFSYYLTEYREGGIKLEKEQNILSFIKDNISLLTGRPTVLLHDDFHLGHIIIKNQEYKGIIDFNGYDYGDPYHDFYNLSLFSRRESIPFINGQINGYFSTKPNDGFWRLYSLYAAMNIIFTIVWTNKYDPNSMEDAMERINIILEDHDDFNLIQPKWYDPMSSYRLS
ncbi:aminoglycoside phosphotransferase family protein [Bacillus spongiae]|uniref:Aminoglycoside phosphotransferase family protein n=1 Tax=Bacillus spongiae TaxID=2683610 RepID=A0ABU8HJW2_9BACI